MCSLESRNFFSKARKFSKVSQIFLFLRVLLRISTIVRIKRLQSWSEIWFYDGKYQNLRPIFAAARKSVHPEADFHLWFLFQNPGHTFLSTFPLVRETKLAFFTWMPELGPCLIRFMSLPYGLDSLTTDLLSNIIFYHPTVPLTQSSRIRNLSWYNVV